MKILFLSNAASIHTVRWVNALSKRGHEVHLVFKADDAPATNLISDQVILHRLNYPGTKGYFLNAWQARKIFNSIKPDIVNAHFASGYGTLARLARVKPLLLSVWGSDVYDFPYQSKLKMKLLVSNLRYPAAIASTSKSMAGQVRTLLNNKTKEILITPFGVDLLKFSDHLKVSKDPNKIVIGNIKSLKEVYGLEYFIKAIGILKQNLKASDRDDLSEKISAVIYGEGVIRGQLEGLVKELGLQETVVFKGEIPNSEVPAALKTFDIFCATSNRESFGVSIVEAMAMSLPVVATDASGFKEVVLDGETGIIVERKNPQLIAQALQTLVLNEALRVDFGRSGRKRVEAFYDWENNVTEMLRIYETLRYD